MGDRSGDTAPARCAEILPPPPGPARCQRGQSAGRAPGARRRHFARTADARRWATGRGGVEGRRLCRQIDRAGHGRDLQGRLERFCPVGAAERGRSDGAAGASGGGRGLAGDAGAVAGPQRAAPADRGDRLASPQPRPCLAGRACGDPADADRHRPRASPAGAAGGGADLGRRQAADRRLPGHSGPRASRACATGRCFWSASPAPSGARSWSASTSPICGSKQRA